MSTNPEHPVMEQARKAIRRALPHLNQIQLTRLAATAEVLAYGEDRGKWTLALPREDSQPYALGRETRKVQR